jgi:type IV pilus assembly protein PilC
MKFHYVAYTLELGIITGRVEAENEVEARGEIVRKGYKPLQVKPSRQLPSVEELFPSLFRVKSADLIRFSRQLAIMVRGGSSLQRALELLQSETSNRVLRRILGSIRTTLDEGGSLSAALAKHPAVFNPRFVSVVEVGEHTGRLAPALEQLAASLAKEYEAIQKAQRTLLMPAVTMVASVVMLAINLTFLLPRLLETFEQMGSDIPLITRIAITLVEGIQNNLLPLFLGAVAFIVVFWAARRIRSVQYGLHTAQVRTPLLGPLVVAKELSQFSRTVAMLLEAGVPLARALPLAISGCKNLALHRAFTAGEESLLTGHGFAETLERHSVLPKLWVALVRVGEESNAMGRAMSDLADAYEKELENRLASLISLLEPLSTVVVGGVVLFMALSMLLPIFSSLDSFA